VPTFRTKLAQSGNNVGIVVPDEIVASFGVGKRVPVIVTVDGGYNYRNTISSMGGRFLISFNAETRAATGLGGGDEVEITLEHDTAARTVEMPAELAAAAAGDPAVLAAWERLAPSHQKEHARAIAEAKGDDTRARRVEKAIEKLRG
jgi:bifunctional DNA-binding transcriptional regulator/antitoxin component of YhaV-PrlF toxin-antitoxin module